VREAIRANDKSITDLNSSIVELKSQITAAQQNAASATTVTENVTTEEIAPSQWIGFGTVNNQTGATSYATLQSDDGALLILSDASAVAVSLTKLTVPFLLFAVNWGAGLVTLTPASGTISSIGNLAAANLTLKQGYSAMIVFDGTNWWAETLPVVPTSFTAVTHEFLTAYNAATGAFTAAQPAYSDISGTPTLPATKAPVTGEYLTGYDATTGAFSASTTAGISVTITTAALTVTGTQGSMTFVGGILTAQTPAT
jgi:hypothetical protein